MVANRVSMHRRPVTEKTPFDGNGGCFTHCANWVNKAISSNKGEFRCRESSCAIMHCGNESLKMENDCKYKMSFVTSMLVCHTLQPNLHMSVGITCEGVVVLGCLLLKSVQVHV
jgi:hypothetical protein